jgi:predicted phosphodiesterase
VRYLIVSDVHGNREALEAVLVHAHDRYDQVLCLGDLVGYGPDPNFAVDWARANAAAVVRGNHDRVVSQDTPLDSYRAEARDGILWTRRALSAENLNYLSEMPRGPVARDGFYLAHGSPLDEDAYLLGPADVVAILPQLRTQLTFFGHTHVQGGFVATPTGVREIDPACPLESRPEDGPCLVNPGSVGQPRDGNWRAAYALYTPEEQRIEFTRVPYKVGPTAEKIVLAGMPATLAARLLMGK